MTLGDRITILTGAAAVVATVGVGTCSTNERFNDVNARIDDVNARIDDVHTDIRELRGLVIELLQQDRANQ